MVNLPTFLKKSQLADLLEDSFSSLRVERDPRMTGCWPLGGRGRSRDR